MGRKLKLVVVHLPFIQKPMSNTHLKQLVGGGDPGTTSASACTEKMTEKIVINCRAIENDIFNILYNS